MNVLLDEDVPEPLAKRLTPHRVQSVRQMGWASIKNGRLLNLVEAANFEIFITGDKSMSNQQRLIGRPFMTLVLSTIDWPSVKQHIPAIADALEPLVLGEIRIVYCGNFVPLKFRIPPGTLLS